MQIDPCDNMTHLSKDIMGYSCSVPVSELSLTLCGKGSGASHDLVVSHLSKVLIDTFAALESTKRERAVSLYFPCAVPMRMLRGAVIPPALPHTAARALTPINTHCSIRVARSANGESGALRVIEMDISDC